MSTSSARRSCGGSLAFHQLPHAAPDAPRTAVGLVRGSRHELGVMAFSMVLRSRGVAVTYVGGDLPVESWGDTVRVTEPDAVVLSVPTVERTSRRPLLLR